MTRFVGNSPFFVPARWTTKALEHWLSNHRAAIEAGVNIGEIDRAWAARCRIELARRSSASRSQGEHG